MFEELEQRLKGLLGWHGGTTASQDSGRIIRQVVDPGFLATQLEHVQQAAAASPGGNKLSGQHYAEAFGELQAATKEHVPGTPFIPRTAANSILQSTLTTCIEGRVGSLLEAVPEGLRRIAHAVLRNEDIFREFGPCDPLWIETKIAEGLTMLEGRPPFPAAPAPAVPLAGDARVIVVGDWGTGLPGAVAVAERMRAEVEAGRGREQHVIHLGDVYYSGWREEYQTRFLPHWPVDRGDREVLSWSLNGNHDMYSGGHGYFGFLLRDERFRGHWLPDPAGQRSSSYFSIENEHWQLLGLDSAYTDHDLAGGQATWVADKLATPGRRTMLLSHHQPLSAYEDAGHPMVETLRRATGGRAIDAWLWGHEHRCTVYGSDPAPDIRFGSCIGHGGVPRLLPDPAPGAAGPQPTWTFSGTEEVGGDSWGRFGFAVLDFDGPAIQIRYIDENGTVNHQEAL